MASTSLSLHSLFLNSKHDTHFVTSNPPRFSPIHPCKCVQIRCAKRSQRTGKLRYPSEKKKFTKESRKQKMDVELKFTGFWRLSNLGVEFHNDPGKDFLGLSDALLQQIANVLKFPVAAMLPVEAFSVVRKSFDARKGLKEPKFVYTVDVDVTKLVELEPRVCDFIAELNPKTAFIEHMPQKQVPGDLMSIISDCKDYKMEDLMLEENGHGGLLSSSTSTCVGLTQKPKVAVVGSGPAGLFACLVLAELGAEVTLIERGQPVEQRGRDIGALVVRKVIQMESNFCFGEGGAGTWSDGKLVTRIGKNSGGVQAVMKTLVHFGAPENILVDGKPHLGTDRLVPLLRNFRRHLQELDVSIRFGTRVDDLLVEGNKVRGVIVSDSSKMSSSENQKLNFDAVILAVGHSARDVYQMLLSHNMDLIPKDFAVGLRIEHPQDLIDEIQYSKLASEVQRGRGRLPVADYKVANYLSQEGADSSDSGVSGRGCYSFCMCPGGQIVLTSTNPSELCINGMSFSRRSSRWANAAMVVTVSSKDFEGLNLHGPLAGVAFQQEIERRAASMGGGEYVVPVQTVTDFLESKLSTTSVPSSSYRLGVRPASLHELFNDKITKALQDSILLFDKELPGFVSKDALLHGVETRTSSPIQIPRDPETYESTSLKGIYPVGEGAGYAGGIVSAAVDGMYAGFAVAKQLGLFTGDIESVLGKSQRSKPGSSVPKY